jgi:hypothetical protein
MTGPTGDHRRDAARRGRAGPAALGEYCESCGSRFPTYDWSTATRHLMTSMRRLPRHCDMTCGAIGKGRARMRLAPDVALDASDFDLEPFLSLLFTPPTQSPIRTRRNRLCR